jgi:hypothetical protein
VGKHWFTILFTKRRIIYFLIFGVLWLFWQLFTDELVEILRNRIPEGGVLMYCITHPYIIMPGLLIISCLLLLWRNSKKSKGGLVTSSIQTLIDEILSTKDYPEKTIYILRVLYHDREKLMEGLYSGNATPLDKRVYHQLALYDVVRFEQRKERIYGSDNTKDVGYWVLTNRGREVIKYLQKNQQVLHNEGSQR